MYIAFFLAISLKTENVCTKSGKVGRINSVANSFALIYPLSTAITVYVNLILSPWIFEKIRMNGEVPTLPLLLPLLPPLPLLFRLHFYENVHNFCCCLLFLHFTILFLRLYDVVATVRRFLYLAVMVSDVRCDGNVTVGTGFW